MKLHNVILCGLAVLLAASGCGKKSAEPESATPAETHKAEVPKGRIEYVSLDTIPFRPLQPDRLLRDISIEEDTTKPAPDTTKPDSLKYRVVMRGVSPEDSLKMVQTIDSLKRLQQGSQQLSLLYRDSLEQSRISIRSYLDSLTVLTIRGDSLEATRITKIARVVEGMKPLEAAALLDRLPPKLAANVVVRLKERPASKVMAALNPAKSSQIALLIKSGEYLKPDDAKSAKAASKAASAKGN